MTRNSKHTAKKQTRESASPAFIAWHVTEARKEGEKGFWTRIGAAWEHEDGHGLTLQLDLVPASGGRIVLRAPKEDVSNEGEGA